MRSLFERFADDAEVEARSPSVAPGKVPITARIQRMVIMRMPDPTSSDAPAPQDALAGALNGGGGAPLPGGVRERFEASLGADLGAVRVHTGPESVAAAQAVGAQAFAVGNDIHFGAGKYQPDDPFGLHLLAHEVAHTQQQSGAAPVAQHKLEVSQPEDAAEVEADRAADAMVKGEQASVGSIAGAQTGLVQREAADKPKGDAAPNYSETFNEHFDNALAALGSILSEQVAGVQELKENVDPDNVDVPMTEKVVTTAITAALGSALGKLGEKIGAEITAKIKDAARAALVQKAVSAALDDAKARAAKIKLSEPKKGAVEYFESLTTILAQSKNKAFAELRHQKKHLWDENDPAGSEKKAAGIQTSLEGLTEKAKQLQITESFDAYCVLLAQADLGDFHGTDLWKADDTKGVLTVEMVCVLPGDLPKITSAELPGTSKKLRAKGKIDSMDGRSLGAMKIPKVIKGKVGEYLPWWDTKKSGVQATIDVRVNETGFVWIGEGTNQGGREWLARRSAGAGTQVIDGQGKPGKELPPQPAVTEDNVFRGAGLLVNTDMATLTLGGLF